MPELPEVETVKNVLKRNLLNLKIKKVEIYYPDMIKTDLNKFKKDLINQEFKDIKRLGKWLIFELSNYFLVSHLRMEGKYFYTDCQEVNKHEHIIFTLSNNKRLKYHDVRKFGVMYLVNKDKLFIDTPLNKLGLEPFSTDLTIKYLKEKLKNKKNSIKTVLLDQEIIAGLGNIYVNEVLFKSRIHPLKKASLLTDLELQSIIDNSRIILTDAIEKGGTTIRSYTSSLGVTGSYQDNLLVHTKSVCPLCNTKIEIIKINGRSTYYCKNCQVQDE